MAVKELAPAIGEILVANPEATFRELVTELVVRGEVDPRAAGDPYVHAWLHARFSRAKAKANAGRINTVM